MTDDVKQPRSMLPWVIGLLAFALLGTAICGGAGVAIYFIAGQRLTANAPGSLESQFRDAINDHQAGNSAKAKDMLKLPESWFLENYGVDKGKAMFDKYNAKSADIERKFLAQLDTANHRKLTRFEVEAYDRTQAPSFFKKALAELTAKPQLLQIFMPDPGDRDPHIVGPFVLADGAHRYFSADVLWYPEQLK